MIHKCQSRQAGIVVDELCTGQGVGWWCEENQKRV